MVVNPGAGSYLSWPLMEQGAMRNQAVPLRAHLRALAACNGTEEHRL